MTALTGEIIVSRVYSKKVGEKWYYLAMITEQHVVRCCHLTSESHPYINNEDQRMRLTLPVSDIPICCRCQRANHPSTGSTPQCMICMRGVIVASRQHLAFVSRISGRVTYDDGVITSGMGGCLSHVMISNFLTGSAKLLRQP